MAVTGLGSAYGNVYESRNDSSKKEVTGNQEAEQTAGKSCGSPNTYVTNSNSSSGSRFQDKKIEKRAKKKSALQNHYQKRKYLREQFEEKQARKALIRGQLQGRPEEKEIHKSLQGKSGFSTKRNAKRAIARYEASILKS